MPQARTAGTSTSKPTTPKRTPAKAAAKGAAAKPAAAKPAAAKPAAAKPAAATKPAAKSAATKPAAKRPAAKTAAKPAAAKAAAAKPAASSRPRVNIDGAQVEAIAERVRKLNEKIIEVGREAGKDTLASYEKALKTIASGVQQSSAKDEIEWIQHLAVSQAKFVRELTDSWAKAARERLN